MPIRITLHSGVVPQLLRTGATRLKFWVCGWATTRFSVMLRRWTERFEYGSNGLIITLCVHEQFALSRKLSDLSRVDRELLGWSEARRNKLYTRLMAPSVRGYEGWHPGQEELTPVILSRSEWQMIDRLCQHLMRSEPEAWTGRVIERIKANPCVSNREQ